MSHYKTKGTEFAFANRHTAYEVGELTKDVYSIDSSYYHQVETDEVCHKHAVLKNWVYNEKPKDESKIIEGKKYRETLFEGTLKECYKFIEDIVLSEGHWIQDPENGFNKIFVK